MPIHDHDCIDIITSRPGTDEVQLIIADPLDWRDPQGHWDLLAGKVSSYATFVRGGGLALLTDPPLPATPEAWIVVYALHPVPCELRPAFDEVTGFLARFGIRFRHEHRPMPAGAAGDVLLH